MSAARRSRVRHRSPRCRAGRFVRRRRSSRRCPAGVSHSRHHSGCGGRRVSEGEDCQMARMNSRIVIVLTVLFAIFATAASAQVRTTGQIVGTVRDPTGAVIPDAEIQIRDVATGATAETKSARDGGFVFVAVQPGRYTLTAVAKGFQPVVVESLNVETSRATNLTVQCESLGVQEAVD